MVTTMLARKLAGDPLTVGRALAVAGRNVTVFRSSRSYWWLVVSGLVEPLVYLLAIGWGVGALVGEITLADGRTVPYLTFLAPGLLAASVMNGAIAESTMNFFAKMKFAKLYDSVLNTPVTPVEVAFGELIWATVRGSLYSIAFLVLMTVLGLTTLPLALAAFPAALLVGLAFGGIGLALATVMRTWQDFDYMGVVQFGLFLFSGTFAPVESYHPAFQVVVQLTPLYHGVEVIRGITLGAADWSMVWHTLYLVVLTALGLAVAARRTSRALRN